MQCWHWQQSLIPVIEIVLWSTYKSYLVRVLNFLMSSLRELNFFYIVPRDQSRAQQPETILCIEEAWVWFSVPPGHLSTDRCDLEHKTRSNPLSIIPSIIKNQKLIIDTQVELVIFLYYIQLLALYF